MIQILLTLVGLFFPTNKENKVNSTQYTTTIKVVNPADLDTGGETQPIPPKK